MKKLNEISKVIYALYMIYHIIYLGIVFGNMQLLNSFQFKFFFINLNGQVAILPFIIYLVAYNLFLFIFVYTYCQEHQLPGFLWLVIALFIPHYFGLLAFIAFKYKKNTIKLYHYLTISGYDLYKVKCDKCHQYIDSDFELCPYCGYESCYTCSNCGQKVKKTYLYCAHCGQENK